MGRRTLLKTATLGTSDTISESVAVPGNASAGSHSIIAQCYLAPGNPSGGSNPPRPPATASSATTSSGTAPAATAAPSPTLTTVARAAFTVEPRTGPALHLTPERGRAGSQVTVTGTGFACATKRGVGAVAVGWDGTELGSTTPDSSGAFTVQITAPKDASDGDHRVQAACRYQTGISAETTFTVSSTTPVGPKVTGGPTVTVQHPTGSPGGTVQVSGAGFTCPGGPVEVAWDGTRIAETRADASGGFSTQVPVPAGASLGGHQLGASFGGDPAMAANAAFTVQPVKSSGGSAGLLIGGLLLAAAIAAGILVRRRMSRRGRTRVSAALRAADGPAWVDVREADPAGGHTTTVRLEAHDDPGRQSIEEAHDDDGHA